MIVFFDKQIKLAVFKYVIESYSVTVILKCWNSISLGIQVVFKID